jgi:peptidoglycan/xylan/chitin deacetylase (PgdA/CDA1 family)
MPDTENELELRGPVTGYEPIIQPVALPGDARIAVNFQFALEAWSGTNVTGSVFGASVASDATEQMPDWATISGQEYGGRTGVWRILRALQEHGIHAACGMSGLVAERWPEVARAVSDQGHEIIGHGYSQDHVMYKLNENEDLDVVVRTTDMIESVTGQRPVGWSSHGSRRGNFTVKNLLKTGYIYTNDFRDADLPYVVAEMGERKLVAMPRSDEVNDMFTVYLNGNTPDALVTFFKRAFDQLYREGEKTPGVVTCVVHATLTGRPWGVSALEECIRYAKSHPATWIGRRREVAANFLRVSLEGNGTTHATGKALGPVAMNRS